MSVAFLIAFDKELPKTKFFYKDVLPSKKTVFSENDSIVFSSNLFPQEQEIAKKLFFGRIVYSIRCSVPLSCNESDGINIAKEYFTCSKEQLVWFKNFLTKKIKFDEDVLFIQIGLGSPINYSGILSKQLDVKNINITNNFEFLPDLIYQFVNN